MKQIGISDYYLAHFDFVAYHDTEFKKYNVPDTKFPDKVVVYTVITGTYDDVHELIYKEPGVDYILFTNNKKITSKSWQVRYVNSALDNILLSREIKMLPHKYLPEYEYSIYIDANAYIYGNIAQLTTFLTPNISFILTKHRMNSSIKEEMEACIESKGISMKVASSQYNSYLRRGFKDDLLLGECGILVRKHNNPALISLMERWWIEFQNGVKRDQLSLMACIFLEQYYEYSLIEGTVFHNQYCIIGGHKNNS